MVFGWGVCKHVKSNAIVFLSPIGPPLLVRDR